MFLKIYWSAQEVFAMLLKAFSNKFLASWHIFDTKARANNKRASFLITSFSQLKLFQLFCASSKTIWRMQVFFSTQVNLLAFRISEIDCKSSTWRREFKPALTSGGCLAWVWLEFHLIALLEKNLLQSSNLLIWILDLHVTVQKKMYVEKDVTCSKVKTAKRKSNTLTTTSFSSCQFFAPQCNV